MKKQEIIDAINASPLTQAVLDTGTPSTFGICKTYEYTVLVGDAETANVEKVSFYVLNDGQLDEVAYWRPGMKQRLYPTPPTPDAP